MSTIEAPVLTAVRNRIGHLTLNRPGGLNALTLPMIRSLWQQLQAWADDPQILAVVLRATGEKAFCAGGDIRALYDSHLAGESLQWAFFEEQYALDGYIHAYRKPFLALMDGLVLGGGMGLAQGASLRVISERVKMAMPEVCIGYFPDVGASYFLSRLPGELGTYFGLTGVQVRTADALYAGLADVCLPNERLAKFDRGLDNLTWTTTTPQEALAALLARLTTQRLPGATLQAVRPAIDEHFAQPDLPSIRAALLGETRPEFRDWAAETVRVLDSRSPLAMSVTLELLRRGRDLPLSDCFALERHLGNQWFAKGDFIEGVRALIIDKDQAPQWNPTTLAALDPARVQALFVGYQAAAGKARHPVSA